MRKIYILILFVSVAFISCKKKCYECLDRPNGTSVCEDDADYDLVDARCCGQIVNGDPAWVFTCEEKE